MLIIGQATPALPARFIAPVRRFLFCLPILILSFILYPSSFTFADTTFVSGAVSGEWTRDGNPYIVEDSTWVPEGEWLTLTAGVEAFFNEGQGLFVFGTMNAEGAEEDSVRFNSLNDSTAWLGITLSRSNEGHEFNYCVYTGATNGITLRDHILLYIGHSVIVSEAKAVGGIRRGNGGDGSDITIEHSVLLGNPAIINLINTRLSFSNSLIYKNIVTPSCAIAASGSVFYDDIRATYSNYSDCRFLFSGDTTDYKSVDLGGTMYNCYSEVTISLRAVPSRITRLESIRAVSGSADLTMDSSVVGHFVGGADVPNQGVTLRNSLINNGMTIRSLSKINIFKCVVFGNTRLACDGTIDIDSSEFRGVYLDGENNEHLQFVHYLEPDVSMVNLSRSLVTMPIQVIAGDSLQFSNNTFCFYKPFLNSAIAIESIAHYRSMIMRNNIIFAAHDSLTLFLVAWAGHVLPVLQYNLIYGFMDYFEYEPYAFEIDSTNLDFDPQFVSVDSSDFHLLADSPCIDSGDSNSPRDPDGTRADIGALAFFQRNWIDPHPQLPPPSFQAFAYPNPFNNITTIRYSLPQASYVKLKVYDLTGREIATLATGNRLGGVHQVEWNAMNFSSGLYLVRLNSDTKTITQKVSLVK